MKNLLAKAPTGVENADLENATELAVKIWIRFHKAYGAIRNLGMSIFDEYHLGRESLESGY